MFYTKSVNFSSYSIKVNVFLFEITHKKMPHKVVQAFYLGIKKVDILK